MLGAGGGAETAAGARGGGLTPLVSTVPGDSGRSSVPSAKTSVAGDGGGRSCAPASPPADIRGGEAAGFAVTSGGALVSESAAGGGSASATLDNGGRAGAGGGLDGDFATTGGGGSDLDALAAPTLASELADAGAFASGFGAANAIASELDSAAGASHSALAGATGTTRAGFASRTATAGGGLEGAPSVHGTELGAGDDGVAELGVAFGATGGIDGVAPGGPDSRRGFGGGAKRRPGGFESVRERGGSDVVEDGGAASAGELGVVMRGGGSAGRIPAASAAEVPGGGRLGVPTESTGMLGIFADTASLAGTLVGAGGSGGFELIPPSRAIRRSGSVPSCAPRRAPARTA